MYISRVRIRGTDTYALHQAIWSLFPDTPDRKRDHLFRVEESSGTVSMALLQSSTEPKSSPSAEVMQTKPFTLNVENGTSYRFKMVTNPTKRCAKTKALRDIQDEADRVVWLQRKLTGANVVVTSMSDALVKSDKCKCSRYVTFEGVLHVTDSAQIHNAVVMGVGRKKHAGAGLLSLAK
jgi:CRISPR system Cascade subunit CasE